MVGQWAVLRAVGMAATKVAVSAVWMVVWWVVLMAALLAVR